MNALVWKDMFLLRTGLIYIAIVAVVFCLLFSDSMVMGLVCPMLFSSLAASSFSWDDQCKWDLFAVSAGIPRNRIVMSKYESATVYVTIGALIGFVVTLVAQPEMDLAAMATLTVTGWVLGIIVVSLSILVNYWTGSSVKAQYVSIIVLIFSVIFLVSTTMIASDILDGDILAVTAVLLVVAALVFAGTYRVSCFRFGRRDL